MNLTPPAAPADVAAAPAPTVSTLQVHDTLAAGSRLWVRGRLDVPPAEPAIDARPWYRRWRRLPAPVTPSWPLQVHTEVSGTSLSTTVPLRPDGAFDACFDAQLPTSRRGWRIARNRVTLGEQCLRACSVVLEAPPEAPRAVAVVLPLAYTARPGGVQQLADWLLAAPLSHLFQRLQPPGAPCPVYYLAAVPSEGPNLHPELALAATSLGWPNGPFLLVGDTGDAVGALAAALDRLRWLFAGRLELLVVNQEPSAENALREACRPRPDRAAVTNLVRADDDVREVCPARPAATVLPRLARPTRSRNVPRHPIVFCHGMLGMSLLRMQVPKETNYFCHLRPFLEERGVVALCPSVEPTGGVAYRAEQLRDQIARWTDEPVNIIAHSMGGLDARYLISRLGFADRVCSLTTVATPHHGSSVADWFCRNFRERVPLLLTLEALGVNVDGFSDCRPARCAAFNQQVPDMPGVRYFSYTAAAPPHRVTPALRRAYNILTPLEGPNDGMVSVRSARWGEEVGTLAVDHFAQTPDLLFVHPHESFDPLDFYGRLIEDLARRGL